MIIFEIILFGIGISFFITSIISIGVKYNEKAKLSVARYLFSLIDMLVDVVESVMSGSNEYTIELIFFAIGLITLVLAYYLTTRGMY